MRSTVILVFLVITSGCIQTQKNDQNIPHAPDSPPTLKKPKMKKKTFGGSKNSTYTYKFTTPGKVFDTSTYFELDVTALKTVAKSVDHIHLKDQQNKNSIIISGEELQETNQLKLHVKTINQTISAIVKFKNGEEKKIQYINEPNGTLSI